MKTLVPQVSMSAVLLITFCVATHAPAQEQARMKPPIQGLVTMGDIGVIANPSGTMQPPLAEVNAHPGVYSAAVLILRWSELEPQRGTFNDSVIESDLKAVREYNAKYPKTPIVAKLRVFGGPNAPAWAKAIDGGPITLTKRDMTLVVAKFWDPEYTKAWRELQAHLAAKYDTEPLMEEVAVSSCGSTSAEPFVMSMLTENIPTFQKNGFNDKDMQACLMGAIDDYAPWKHTAIDYTFNEYRTYNADGKTWNLRPEYTAEVMEAFRKKYGARAVIANHGLDDTTGPALAAVLAAMKKLGPPMAFQTAHQHTNFELAVKNAREYGATEMELWNSKDTGKGANVSYEQVKEFAKTFPYTNMLALQK